MAPNKSKMRVVVFYKLFSIVLDPWETGRDHITSKYITGSIFYGRIGYQVWYITRAEKWATPSEKSKQLSFQFFWCHKMASWQKLVKYNNKNTNLLLLAILCRDLWRDHLLFSLNSIHLYCVASNLSLTYSTTQEIAIKKNKTKTKTPC